MSKGNESWGRFAAKAAMLGAVVLVAAFVGVRLANAGPGEPVRKALTVSGTLTGPMVGATTTATFRFYRALMSGEALCSPVVSIRDGMERNPTTGAFSVDVSLEQDDVAGEPRRKCPDTLFHDPNAYVEVVIGGTSVVPRRPINPVPYAVYAQQYGTPDCPVGYELRPDAAFTGLMRLCERRRADGTVYDEVVRVGNGASAFWIDRYEASVSAEPDGSGSLRFQRPDDFPSTFPVNGLFTAPMYANSKVGVTPAAAITWFQAAAACRASGKRLPSGEEWFAAARGTPDPGAVPGMTGECRTDNHTLLARVTGGARGTGTRCISSWGAEDMIGNLSEWTTDWYAGLGVPQATGLTTSSWPSDFNGDTNYNIASGARTNTTLGPGLPAAALRGGAWNGGGGAGVFSLELSESPTRSGSSAGFRCVIPR